MKYVYKRKASGNYCGSKNTWTKRNVLESRLPLSPKGDDKAAGELTGTDVKTSRLPGESGEHSSEVAALKNCWKSDVVKYAVALLKPLSPATLIYALCLELLFGLLQAPSSLLFCPEARTLRVCPRLGGFVGLQLCGQV